jgi:hypothetical protein
LVLGAAASCGAPPDPAPTAIVLTATVEPPAPPPPASSPEDERAIVDMVSRAQRAGLERGDIDAFMEMFSARGQITSARGAGPSPYDVTLDRSEIEATRRVIARRNGPVRFRSQGTDVRVRGNAATLRWIAVIGYGDYEQGFEELYQLGRTAHGFRVVKLRYWPAWHEQDGVRTEFDAAFFRGFDRQVEELGTGGDRRQALYALLSSFRFREACSVGREVCAAAGADAWSFRTRATACMMIGEVAEAEQAFDEADALDGGSRSGSPKGP